MHIIELFTCLLFYQEHFEMKVEDVHDSLLIFLTIAHNAEVNASVVVEKVVGMSPNMGYDAQNDVYVDMINVGITVPTKVVRTVLIDAAGVAFLLITAETVVTHLPKLRLKMYIIVY